MADIEVAEDAPAPAPPAPSGRKGLLRSLAALLLITVIAVGAGGGLGLYLASTVEETLVAKAKAAADAAQPARPTPRYSGDMVVQELDAVITNLAVPEDTWIRLETAIIFASGALTDPQVAAAEIQQDILAYARTMTIQQLEGPSALQHLREDLNERVALRTGGQVSELVIQTMIVQ